MTELSLPRRVTSREVAQLAGVSRSTVSNILNGNDSRFPEVTRERVRTAARQLRYTPSQAGRSLVNGRSSTVVLLLPNAALATNLQEAIESVVVDIDSFGGNVVIRFSSPTPARTTDALIGMAPLAVLDLGVLGIDQLQRLEEHGILVAPSPDTIARTRFSDIGIARIQADALRARGERTLWFAPYVTGGIDPYSQMRLTALEEYCRERALVVPRSVRVPLEIEGAVAALRLILDNTSGPPPAVVCANDDVGLAILAAARAIGVEVPEQISLIGLDNSPLGRLWQPRLTTVDVDVRWFVEMLAADLRARLQGDPTPDQGDAGERFTLIPGDTH